MVHSASHTVDQLLRYGHGIGNTILQCMLSSTCCLRLLFIEMDMTEISRHTFFLLYNMPHLSCGSMYIRLDQMAYIKKSTMNFMK
jgi:hypothetical protein